MAPSRRRVTRRVEYRVARLSAAERAALIATCREIYQAFFHVHSEEFFLEYVLFPRSLDTRVYVFYDGEHAVGFSTVFVLQLSGGPRPLLAIRASIYASLDYKVDTDLMTLGMRCTLRTRLRWPLARLYFCAFANSPVPYALLTRSFARAYPRADGSPAPAAVERIRQLLLEAVGQAAGESHPWVVKAPYRIKDAAHLKTKDRLLQDPAARFYLRINPDFDAGDAVLVMVPLDASNLWSLVRSFLRVRSERRTRRQAAGA